MIDNLMEISLPYFVYNIKTVKDINPITRNIQPSTHKISEGPSYHSSGGLSSQGHSIWFRVIKLNVK